MRDENSAYDSPQLVREAGEERGPGRHSGPHGLRFLPGRALCRREAARPEVVLGTDWSTPAHRLGGGSAMAGYYSENSLFFPRSGTAERNILIVPLFTLWEYELSYAIETQCKAPKAPY